MHASCLFSAVLALLIATTIAQFMCILNDDLTGRIKYWELFGVGLFIIVIFAVGLVSVYYDIISESSMGIIAVVIAIAGSILIAIVIKHFEKYFRSKIHTRTIGNIKYTSRDWIMIGCSIGFGLSVPIIIAIIALA
jgi:membrane-anchored protein YejM (alkaline phosphatase superfamily)